MGSAEDTASTERARIDAWLEPLSGDSPCGEDLGYDNAFLELEQAAAGRPETQFSPAEPPDWSQVETRAEELLDRTRDLRVALHWCRAAVNLRGFPSLASGLRLVHGLLDRHWEGLHPLPDPDDGDPYARLNEVARLADRAGFLVDLRSSLVSDDRSIGQVRVRDIEVALDKLEARAGETPLVRGQIEQMLGAAVDSDAFLATVPASALQQLDELQSLLEVRAGAEKVPDFDPLRAMVQSVAQVMPGAAEGAGGFTSSGSSDGASRFASSGGGSLPGAVNSRDDALRAIDMVVAYLERAEPTNPAQLLLRRTRRLLTMNFLELLRELAPEALPGVSRIMGSEAEGGAGEGGWHPTSS